MRGPDVIREGEEKGRHCSKGKFYLLRIENYSICSPLTSPIIITADFLQRREFSSQNPQNLKKNHWNSQFLEGFLLFWASSEFISKKNRHLVQKSGEKCFSWDRALLASESSYNRLETLKTHKNGEKFLFTNKFEIISLKWNIFNKFKRKQIQF